jgi:hypothetical protein
VSTPDDPRTPRGPQAPASPSRPDAAEPGAPDPASAPRPHVGTPHGAPPPQHGPSQPPSPQPPQAWPPQPPPQGAWPPQPPPQGGWPPQPPPQGGWPPQPPPQGGWPPQPPPQGGWPSPAPPAGPSVAGRATGAAAKFVNVYLKRAFRLQLSPDDVLPEERLALERAPIPVTDPTVQSFLTWRKSLLTVVAVFLVPLAVLQGIETFANMEPQLATLNAISALLWMVTAGFTLTTWVLLKRWTDWARQRRWLLRAWLVYFLAPFLAWLFPFRSSFSGITQQQALLAGVLFSISAVLMLAPKALSLMPGLIRASIVAKALFPGAAAPGWLISLAAPVYALIAYVVLITPYQITGNVLFLLAMIGLIGAPLWLARAGAELSRPMPLDVALERIRTVRRGYNLLNGIGAFFLLIALSDMVAQLDVSFLSALNLVLALVTNVLVLGLVATDLLLVSLDRARSLTADDEATELRQKNERRLERFLSNAPGLSLSTVSLERMPPLEPPPKGGAPPSGTPPPSPGGPPAGGSPHR